MGKTIYLRGFSTKIKAYKEARRLRWIYPHVKVLKLAVKHYAVVYLKT